MKREITITINGTSRTDQVEPRLLLIHYLRDVCGLTGPHIGCETSLCGACTVEMDGMAVKSCSIFTVQADGHRLLTIEGLAENGALHAVQEAFWNEHGLQCGFCTPGIVVTLGSCAWAAPGPREPMQPGDLARELDGNLCRCTGYQQLLAAVTAALAPGGAA